MDNKTDTPLTLFFLVRDFNEIDTEGETGWEGVQGAEGKGSKEMEKPEILPSVIHPVRGASACPKLEIKLE